MIPVSYTLTGAVEACGLSETTLRDAIEEGDLVAHYKGRRPVILRRDLEEWVESLPTQRRAS